MKSAKDHPERPLSWGERVEQRKQRAHQSRTPRRRWVLARWRAIRHALGTRAKISVEGVRYRERLTVPLRRALSDTGAGVKEYRVRFAHGSREPMKIRATRSRIFADLMPDPRMGFYEQVLGSIRPGVRVLELGCGTGGGSRMLSRSVGPSGGVVSISRDGESIRFARQRYPLKNTGFELGWIETLSGEIDAAFDVVCVVDPLRDASDGASKSKAIGELWRVLAPGGVLVLMCSGGESAGEGIDRLKGGDAMGFKLLQGVDDPAWIGAKAFKPGNKPPPDPPKQPPEGSW